MSLIAIVDAVIGFFTVKKSVENAAVTVESEMKSAYLASEGARKIDCLVAVSDRSNPKEPIQTPETTRGK